MSNLKKLPVVLAAALALGFAATLIALMGDPGFGAMEFGPWRAWPRLGGSDIDPYARAAMAVEGALPLGSGEGLAFVARADSPARSARTRVAITSFPARPCPPVSGPWPPMTSTAACVQIPLDAMA